MAIGLELVGAVMLWELGRRLITCVYQRKRNQMSSSPFSLWDNEVLTAPAGMVHGVPSDLAISSTVVNSPELPSMRLEILYSAASPSPDIGANWRIGAVVESKDPTTNAWYRIANQFDDFKHPDRAQNQEIRLDPNTFTIDPGIPIVVFVANTEIGHISASQGKVPSTGFRVKLQVVDFKLGTPEAFAGVTVTAFGERHD